jgi:mannose-6-phosphate isomerase
VELLENPVQRYAWGSTTAIPELLGQPVDGSPQAELWLGAHPSAPSQVVRGSERRPLDDVVTREAGRYLGESVRTWFGDRLPFLLKVLAAEQPLSIQVHPSAEEAARGYAAEDAARVPRDASDRVYKDPHHKPEMIMALTPFEALCGFRDPRHTAAVIAGLGAPFAELVKILTQAEAQVALRSAVTMLLTGGERSAELVGALVRACSLRLTAGSPHAADDELVTRLAESYPGDPGVAVALLLNRVTLAPGEAIFLPAGNVHAYLHGVGVEVMAASDNVLRGGLTSKHVDVPGLIKVVDFAPAAVPLVPATRSGRVRTWRAGAGEFQLIRVQATPEPVRLLERGPRIALCLDGVATLRSAMDSVQLSRGTAVVVADADGELDVTGPADVVIAAVRHPLDVPRMQ